MYNSKLPGFDDSFVLVSCGYTADIRSGEVPTVFEIPLLASFIVPICTILNIDKKHIYKYLLSQSVDEKKKSTPNILSYLLSVSVQSTTMIFNTGSYWE